MDAKPHTPWWKKAILVPYRLAFAAALTTVPLTATGMVFHLDVRFNAATWLGYGLAVWGVCAAIVGLTLLGSE